jgi:protoporphyrin/coproporphyrin ferrochelatase
VSAYEALLLVSFGGPERAEEVIPFLRRVVAGRGVPEERVQAVAEHYYSAGGASPINGHCRELMDALASELADLSLGLYWGNRNWHPFLEDTVAKMRDDGVRRALAFVTSAYGGYSSCRQYLEDIAAARAKVGPGAPEIHKLRIYYNHPGWVGPWATSLMRALRKCQAESVAGLPGPNNGTNVLFSAHSIPVAMAGNSPYVQHVTEAARLAAGLAGTASWQLVWQSRSGDPASPWLGPDVCQVIEASVAKRVVVVPIGFVCENMEVAHDLDVEAAASAHKVGTRFVRANTVSSDPAFVTMVRELVEERLSPGGRRAAAGDHGPWPDTCPDGHCPAPSRSVRQGPHGETGRGV